MEKGKKGKIAIIGSGLSGLTAAYMLNSTYDVTVFEKSPAIGMGAHAVSFDDGHGKEITIDFPHRVLSPRYYLNLSTLLHNIGIKLKPEDYCLSVSDLGGKTFFYWRNIRLFGGGRLLPTINPIAVLKNPMTYFIIIRDAWCFFKEAKRDLESGICNNISTGEYFDHLVKNRGYSRILIDQMIRPSLSIVATCCYGGVDSIPADISIRYLTLALTPPGVSVPGPARGVWRPEGGVNQIVATLSASLTDIRVNTAIEQITKDDNGKTVIVDQKGNKETFDHVIFATQANQALRILNESASKEQQEVLSAFKHEKSTLVLHTDRAAMPLDESSWTSFNMLLDPKKDAPMATLWMNRNHPKLANARDVFQTWNPIMEIDKEKVLYEFSFERPIMDRAAADAVATLERINGADNIWFIGAYSIYGIPLLESAVLSAYRVVEKLGVQPPRITPFPQAPTKDAKTTSIATFLPGMEPQFQSPKQRGVIWRPKIFATIAAAMILGYLGSKNSDLVLERLSSASYRFSDLMYPK